MTEELNNQQLEDNAVRNFGTNNAALDFWNDPKEDIYQDYLNLPKNDLHLITHSLNTHV